MKQRHKIWAEVQAEVEHTYIGACPFAQILYLYMFAVNAPAILFSWKGVQWVTMVSSADNLLVASFFFCSYGSQGL